MPSSVKLATALTTASLGDSSSAIGYVKLPGSVGCSRSVPSAGLLSVMCKGELFEKIVTLIVEMINSGS